MSNNAEMSAMYSRFVEDQSQERLGVHFPTYMLHTERQNANFFFWNQEKSWHSKNVLHRKTSR